MIITGNVWKFPQDDINTDQIRAYMYSHLPVEEQAKHCLETLDPEFAERVKPGDIVVAGRNFGCGSSRPAHATFVALGVSAIIAESFGRLFFRHTISAGRFALPVPGILDLVQNGDRIEIDTDTSVIRNLANEQRNGRSSLDFKPLPPFLAGMVDAGGEFEYLKRRLGRA